MVEGHHGSNAAFVARGQDAAVVIQGRNREMSAFRLNAGPFDREAIAVEAEAREQTNIVGETMIMIAGVEGRFFKQGGAAMFQNPQVAIDVVAFDLMRG